MARKPETTLHNKIIAALKEEFGGWWVHIHVSEFDEAGLPDIFGCVDGLFFGLEVKRPPPDYKDPTPLQVETMRRIREDGEGVSCVVISPEEAISVVGKALRES